ncbi:hypothetical protein NSTC731_05810 [Nostoc sp. DSM 114167]|jgi:hypothetical protein
MWFDCAHQPGDKGDKGTRETRGQGRQGDKGDKEINKTPNSALAKRRASLTALLTPNAPFPMPKNKIPLVVFFIELGGSHIW